jgi:hypothetical protein
MSNVKIYQFKVWDTSIDDYRQSRRWGTRDGIKKICGIVLEETELEINENVIGTDIEGLTVRDFNPTPNSGFQTQVKV